MFPIQGISTFETTMATLHPTNNPPFFTPHFLPQNIL